MRRRKTLPGTIRFGPFEVDAGARLLRRRGLRIKLRRQSFEVLAALLEHSGKVVTREDLRRRLWPETIFVDFEDSLNSAVKRLRRALGDSAVRPEYVETIPRVGYRFAGRVEESPSESAEGALRLLVLPFSNLSGEPAQDYLCDGLTEEMIGQLARIDGDRLGVIARTTAMRYKGTTKSARAIARELALDYLLEGSVRSSAGFLRVSTQLIDAANEQHVWAKTYDGHLGDVLRFQEEVAHAVAGEVRSSLAGPAAAAVSPAAYDAYIRGRFHAAKWTAPGFTAAVASFEEAVAIQPGFAEAWAALAVSWSNIALWNYASPREAYPKAERAARCAIEIDETLCGSHHALGMVHWYYGWDLRAGKRELERAVELSPSDTTSRLTLAIFLGSMEADFLRAASEAQRARDLDPLSVAVRSTACWIPFWARNYDQAIAHARETLDLDDNVPVALLVIGAAARAKGAYKDAIVALEQSVAKFGDPLSFAYLGMAYALAGNPDRARDVLRLLERSRRPAEVRPIFPAYIYAALGENRTAAEHLEKAFEQRDPLILWLRVSPDWDILRGDSRFQQLLARLDVAAPVATQIAIPTAATPEEVTGTRL